MLPLIILAATAVAYFVLSRILTSRRHARLAAEWGCQPAYKREHRWPIGLDNVWYLLQADKAKDVPGYFTDMLKSVGVNTWTMLSGGTQLIQTIEPENVKAILATQFKDFETGELRAAIFFGIFGKGIFSDDGKAWEHSRALLRPQFARDNIADLEALERHVQNLMRHFNVDPKTDWTSSIDLSPAFFRLTLDSATEFLFGQSVGSQLAALPQNEKADLGEDDNDGLNWVQFGTAFNYGMACVATKFRMQEIHWMYNTPAYRQACKDIHKFADHFVQRSLENRKRRHNEEKQLEDGKKYVFAEELAEATQDPVELRNQLLHILLAGRDTTSGLLGWVFYSLAKKPDLYQRLRTTVLEDFGSYEEPENMDFAGLKACQFLQHVINETLRMFPVVPFNARRAVTDTTLPVGGGPDQKSPIFIAKGWDVNYSVHLMHRRQDIWGPDAEEFNPDRWRNRKSGWEFLPFNGGPRICLGQQYALTTAAYTIVRIVQRFDQLGEPVDIGSLQRPKHAYDVTTAPLEATMSLHVATA